MKKVIPALAILTLVSSFLVGTIYAKNEDVSEIPDVAGVYDDPGHPGVKVRVFVYKEKPVTSVNNAIIACSPDLNSEAVVGPTGWKLPSNWTYRLNTSSVPVSVGGSNLVSFASTAFSNWKAATENKVNFASGEATLVSKQANDGQNIIAWGRTSGSALAVTYTRYYPSTGEVVDVDTIMNKKFKWGWSETQCFSGVYDAQNILTHELGHWVGLTDHYTNDYVNNTMYGYGSAGEVKKDSLSTGDTLGANNIY